MCAPPELRRRGAFFTQAFYRPCSDEFVNLFGPVSDLRIALADVDDFHAGGLREFREILRREVLLEIFRARVGRFSLENFFLRYQ